METAAATGASRTPGMAVESPPRVGAVSPEPLRPRGGFGGYLHELRRERGITIRHLAAAARVHHTYVSKLERGDRQAPEEAVVEALAAALQATPAQLDQLRWRAGLSPRGDGAPGSGDPTLTLVAEALGAPDAPQEQRDQLRQGLAQVVEEWKRRKTETGTSGQAGFFGTQGSHNSAPPPYGSGSTPFFAGHGMANAPLPPTAPIASTPPTLPNFAGLVPEAPPDGRATMLAAMVGSWQTVEEAAAELRVTAAYLTSLVQSGHLKAWALPGAPAGSTVGLRLRREDVLALLQPIRV
ncbi:MAG TPA: helix-turn-helix domain-containing protein [Chloroflexota bacterium]|nr:helix-turn-helix domain-containing protein [Chloroflexota bacterium]